MFLRAITNLRPSERTAVLDPDHNSEATRVGVFHAKVEEGRGEPVLDDAKRVSTTRPRIVATRPMAFLACFQEIAPLRQVVELAVEDDCRAADVPLEDRAGHEDEQ